MSDLYIMFDETYDAPKNEKAKRLLAIATKYKLTIRQVIEEYNNYIDSDQFYYERGF